MHLTLMRHGDAGVRIEDNPDLDHKRVLTATGIELVARVAEGLKALGVRPTAIVASSFPRTHETALLVAQALTPGREPELCDWLVEFAPLVPLIEGLNALEDGTLVVTHRDVQERVAAYIVDGNEQTKVISLPFASVLTIDSLGATIQPGVGIIEWALQGPQIALLANESSGYGDGGIPLISDSVTLRPLALALISEGRPVLDMK